MISFSVYFFNLGSMRSPLPFFRFFTLYSHVREASIDLFLAVTMPATTEYTRIGGYHAPDHSLVCFYPSCPPVNDHYLAQAKVEHCPSLNNGWNFCF